jgi:hypothetical protein
MKKTYSEPILQLLPQLVDDVIRTSNELPDEINPF